MRAQVIADYLENNTREGYAAERAKTEAERKGRQQEELGKGQETVSPAWGRFHQGGGKE